jgi:endonuclease-8
VPEGDTVWLAGRRLDAAMSGQRLTTTDFRVPAHATVDLVGRTVVSVTSVGKHLLTRIEGDVTLHTHFRMDGAWHLYRPGAPWRGGPAWQVRVVLSNDRWTAVGYRLPVVEILPTPLEQRVIGHLGPDLLSPAVDLQLAVRNLERTPDRGIGEALLDQRNLAGIGTLYRAETLFLEGVNPTLRVRDVPDLPRLVERACRLLRANASIARQITTGDSRRGHEHWVFERAGRPCRRCGTPIASAMLGQPPFARVAYWCPGCQPGAAAPTSGRPASAARSASTDVD